MIAWLPLEKGCISHSSLISWDNSQLRGLSHCVFKGYSAFLEIKNPVGYQHNRTKWPDFFVSVARMVLGNGKCNA